MKPSVRVDGAGRGRRRVCPRSQSRLALGHPFTPHSCPPRPCTGLYRAYTRAKILARRPPLPAALSRGEGGPPGDSQSLRLPTLSHARPAALASKALLARCSAGPALNGCPPHLSAGTGSGRRNLFSELLRVTSPAYQRDQGGAESSDLVYTANFRVIERSGAEPDVGLRGRSNWPFAPAGHSCNGFSSPSEPLEYMTRIGFCLRVFMASSDEVSLNSEPRSGFGVVAAVLGPPLLDLERRPADRDPAVLAVRRHSGVGGLVCT